MDTTAIGIGLGVAMACSYALLRMWAKLSFELAQTVLIFLSAFSVPAGVSLIFAGIVGNPSELPSSWREYVSVAGIVAIGLAFHYVGTAFHNSWMTRNAQQTSAGEVGVPVDPSKSPSSEV